jgi:hypothetical protein
VYAYLDPDAAAVRVSVHLDDTWPALHRGDSTVPLRVDVGDATVFDDTDTARSTARAVPATVWVLHHDDDCRTTGEVTVHASEQAAVSYLAGKVREDWHMVEGRTDVPDFPPADDAEAVAVYFRHSGEGYKLYEEEVRGRSTSRGGIAGQFTPDEVECLVITAGEAVHGNAVGDETLSTRQVELAHRAYDALARWHSGEDNPPPPAASPVVLVDGRDLVCPVCRARRRIVEVDQAVRFNTLHVGGTRSLVAGCDDTTFERVRFECQACGSHVAIPDQWQIVHS